MKSGYTYFVIALLLVCLTGIVAADYIIPVESLTVSPVDAQTTYLGWMPYAPITGALNSSTYVPANGTITAAEIYEYSGTAGSNEVYRYYVRVNNTTDYWIGNLSVNTNERRWTNLSMSIPVYKGNFIQIKRIQPTWATNPATDIVGGYLWVNTSEKGYVLPAHSIASSPANNNSNSFGLKPTAVETTAGRNKIYIPQSGIITSAYVLESIYTRKGSNESHTIYLNVSGGSPGETVGTIADNTTPRRLFYNASFSKSVDTTKYIEFFRRNPAWAQTPTGTVLGALVWINTSASTESSGVAYPVQALSSTPADSVVTYFGNLPKVSTTTVNISKIYFTTRGYITRANIYTYSGTAGTAQNWNMSIRKNGATDYLIENMGVSANERIFNNESMLIPIAVGDFIEIKSKQPLWTTNPATSIWGGYVWLSKNSAPAPAIDIENDTSICNQVSFRWNPQSELDSNVTMIYLNGTFVENVSTTYSRSKVFTGLTNGVAYTISTKNVDLLGVASDFTNNTATPNAACLSEPPVVNFTSDVTTGYAPLSVAFTDESTGTPTNWSWYFGDEVYNGTWTQVYADGWDSLPIHLTRAASLSDGSIVFAGGINETENGNLVWRSTDVGASWTKVATADWSGRNGGALVALPNDTLLYIGGYGLPQNGIGGSDYKNETWVSEDKGYSWRLINSTMPGWTARSKFAYARQSDNSIVIAGGANTSGSVYHNDTWRTTDLGKSWVRMNISPGWQAVSDTNIVALQNNSLMLFGGATTAGVNYNTTWMSNNNGTTWVNVNQSSWSKRSAMASIVPQDGSVLFAGGTIAGSGWTNEIWRTTNNGTSWDLVNDNPDWSIRLNSQLTSPTGTLVLLGAPDEAADVWELDPRGSTEQNPTHIYTIPGNYSVTLMAGNDRYNKTLANRYIIQVLAPIPAPAANFTSNVTSGMESLAVQFNDTSTNTPTSWNWSFQCWTTTATVAGFTFESGSDAGWTPDEFVQGDAVNTFDVIEDANHTGTYGARLLVETIVEPDAGQITATSPADIPADFEKLSIWMQFKQGYNLGGASATVFLTDADGTNGQNINGGAFTGQPDYNSRLATGDWVNIIFEPSQVDQTEWASFIAGRTDPAANFSIQFEVTGQYGDIAEAYFDDIVADDVPLVYFSSSQNPDYTFDAGNYSISLGVSNDGGYDKTPVGFHWINVSSGVTAPVANFTKSNTLIRIPGTLQVNDTSTGTPTAWNWSWGDSTWTNGTTQNVTHEYAKRGMWNIYLIASNAGGSNTSVSQAVRVAGYDDLWY